jgi:hypothetical protein
LNRPLDIVLRCATAALIALTVFTPVTAEAACKVACAGACTPAQMTQHVAQGSMGGCCSGNATLMSGSCNHQHEAPTFTAPTRSAESPGNVAHVGSAGSLTDGHPTGRLAGSLPASARSPGDPLLGTRLRL